MNARLCSILLIGLSFGLAIGCETSAPATACVPGSTQICVGLGRCEGVQVCAEDGARYEPCVCGVGVEDAGMVTDAGVADAGPSCTPLESMCSGGADEDCDGRVDCADPDCASAAACMACENPMYDVLTSRWNQAGVRGDIPDYPVHGALLMPGESIQARIDAAPMGSTVRLAAGEHILDEPLIVPSGIVLRGEDREATRLISRVRMTQSESAWTAMIQLGDLSDRDVSFSGLENFTYRYEVDGCEPQDDLTVSDPSFSTVYLNNPCGRSDLHTNAVQILGHDNWLRSIDIVESGSDPVILFGDHNTVDDVFVHRSYNKGPGGSGYFYCAGSDNLIVNSRFQRLRHVTIDGYGASTDFPGAWNVFVNNTLIAVEFNFHNGDEGFNLVEFNTVSPEPYHHVGGQPFNTGGAEWGHLPPGMDNYIYNNDTSGSGKPGFAGMPGVVYTTDGEYDSFPATDLPEPACGRFFTRPGVLQ